MNRYDGAMTSFLRSPRVIVVVLATLAAGGSALLGACGNDTATIPDETDSGSSSSGDGGGSSGDIDSGSSGNDGGTNGDGSTSEDSGCTNPPPVLDGGGPCGALDFGAPAAPFGGVDGGNAYAGGTFAPGIYDAVGAERGSGLGGSWRETFVVDGTGRFTRTRQIDTGTSGGPGPVTQRSGTVTTAGTNATFTYDCAVSGGAGVDAGADTLPFEVVKDGCNVTYRYGATGIRVTLKRR